MSIISLAALTILDAGPIGQVEAAANAGFTHVGLRLQPLLPSDIEIVGQPAKEEALTSGLARTGLEVLEIGVFPIRGVEPAQSWPDVIAFSAKLGAKFLVCPIEAEDRGDQVAGIRAIADLGARYGLDALVEFNPYSACTSLDQACALVAEAGHPNIGLVIDAFHLSRSGGAPGDLGKVDPDLLRLVHFCDAAPLEAAGKSQAELKQESRTARMLPGEGALWLAQLLDAMPDDIPISVEAPSKSLAGLSATDRARRALDATTRFCATRAKPV